MLAYLIGWVVAAAVFLALDALWFSQMVPRFYRPIIGSIMRPQPNITAAVAFYLIYVCAIMFFAVVPGLGEGSVTKATLNGAVFGFVAYATFDLSNHAIMRAWSTKLTVVDMAWGTFATALTSATAYSAASALS